MSEELSKSRRSVAFPLLPLSFLCLPSQLGFLLSFLLCPEEKGLVVWGAAATHFSMKKGWDAQGDVVGHTLSSLSNVSGAASRMKYLSAEPPYYRVLT